MLTFTEYETESIRLPPGTSLRIRPRLTRRVKRAAHTDPSADGLLCGSSSRAHASQQPEAKRQLLVASGE